MIELTITQDQLERAEGLYPFDKLNGSITKGESNIFGAVGEILVYDYLSKITDRISFNSTYDYDLVYKGFSIDVKTKRTTVTPAPEYLCSISSFNTKQRCDYYFFIRVKEDFSMGWLLGYIAKKQFFRDAVFKRRGEKDVNGWKFKDDCYNMQIKDLIQFPN